MIEKVFVVRVRGTESVMNVITTDGITRGLTNGLYVMPDTLGVTEVVARNSYRDPDLGNQWLKEAEWRAQNDRTKLFFTKDGSKIIVRLIKEIRKLNRMLGR